MKQLQIVKNDQFDLKIDLIIIQLVNGFLRKKYFSIDYSEFEKSKLEIDELQRKDASNQ